MAADYVNIELDKKRKLRFTHNEMADIEEQTGKSFLQLLGGQQFHGCRLLLYYGLRFMDKTITPRKAGELIQNHWLAKGKTLDELLEVFTRALEAAHILRSSQATTGDEEAEGTEDEAPEPEAA